MPNDPNEFSIPNPYEDEHEAVPVEIPVDDVPVEEGYEAPPQPVKEGVKRFSPYSPVEGYSSHDNTMMNPSTRMSIEQITEIRNNVLRKLKTFETDEDKAEAVSSVVEMFDALTTAIFIDDRYCKFFDRPNAELGQYVDGDKGQPLRVGHSVVKLGDESKLSGENAVRFISQAAGIGNTVRVPLWHSGLIVTLEPFREREVIDMILKISDAQIELGALTQGACFTGDDVYMTGIILDRIFSHVVDCNLKNFTPEKLRKIIRVTDIPLLLAGALAAMYPKGYPLYHPCRYTVDGSCDYVITISEDFNGAPKPDSLLDFKKVVWTDRTRIPKYCREHMSVVSSIHKFEDVMRYQKELEENLEHPGHLIRERDGLKITAHFKVPSIEEYVTQCSRWIGQLNKMIEDAVSINKGLTKKEYAEERRNALVLYSNALDIQKSLNWYSHLTVRTEDGDVKVIDDLETIKQSLDSLASIEGLTSKINAAIQDYKEQVTVSYTGLPNFECPACHRDQVDEDAQYASLIPLNMVGYFFTIMGWRAYTHQLHI